MYQKVILVFRQFEHKIIVLETRHVSSNGLFEGFGFDTVEGGQIEVEHYAAATDKVLRQIADRIREIRKELKITQTTIIEDTGINLGNLEATPKNLTITTIVILCDYFEVSLEEFFRGIGNQYHI